MDVRDDVSDRAELHLHRGPVGWHEREVPRQGPGVEQLLPHRAGPVLVDLDQVPAVQADELVAGPARQRAGSRVGVHIRPVGVGQQQRVRGVVEQPLQPRAGGRECLLVELLVGDVQRQADRSGDPTVGVPLGFHVVAPPPVSPPPLERRGAARQCIVEGLQHRRGRVRLEHLDDRYADQRAGVDLELVQHRAVVGRGPQLGVGGPQQAWHLGHEDPQLLLAAAQRPTRVAPAQPHREGGGRRGEQFLLVGQQEGAVVDVAHPQQSTQLRPEPDRSRQLGGVAGARRTGLPSHVVHGHGDLACLWPAHRLAQAVGDRRDHLLESGVGVQPAGDRMQPGHLLGPFPQVRLEAVPLHGVAQRAAHHRCVHRPLDQVVLGAGLDRGRGLVVVVGAAEDDHGCVGVGSQQALQCRHTDAVR